jgi:hypothetical protein
MLVGDRMGNPYVDAKILAVEVKGCSWLRIGTLSW